jgi:hypothetical protein
MVKKYVPTGRPGSLEEKNKSLHKDEPRSLPSKLECAERR